MHEPIPAEKLASYIATELNELGLALEINHEAMKKYRPAISNPKQPQRERDYYKRAREHYQMALESLQVLEDLAHAMGIEPLLRDQLRDIQPKL